MLKFIDNSGITDPELNLAIEEYALKTLDPKDTYLLFYVNRPSIIIGKNQNTYEEINLDYVKEKNLYVVRRLSGGGAVYHDEGNLNFSFIAEDDGHSFHNFKKFTEPVVQALAKLGVQAELSGRNDIHVGERKISGNAQFTTKGRMFSHGTLMLDSEIENVVSALNVKDEKIRSKGIKSIRSRVANVSEFLEKPISMDEFKQLLLQYIFNTDGEIPTYTFTEEDWEAIHKLSKERYQNWDWNYGKSPAFDMQRSKRFTGGNVDIRLNVRRGHIEACKIYGDFFGVRDVSELEELLVGTKYDSEELSNTLEEVDISSFFGKVTKEEFLDLLY
ncbi:lipoate--protein ligase [Alkalicoccobacillus gibsonii]|jgi:lipoate---protein ligase|uniref:lipoate--protein ligase n=1 Tax=Alkalicoccobacillus gibsonii TaxID=79881 RepID=A0ABU9VGJ1_9BACI|nr:lipoate--protein ligase [Alkalicoccobacillus gibsonii]MBM0064239.1 lipoate--protein ligase [Alkalicoccobacillus gibsonii]